MGGGGGGEIPKGGRAGRARSLGIWPAGGEIPRDLAPGGRNPWDNGSVPYLQLFPYTTSSVHYIIYK